MRTPPREGARNSSALALPLPEGLWQILPGLSPNAPRRPPFRAAARPPSSAESSSSPPPHHRGPSPSRKCSSLLAGGKRGPPNSPPGTRGTQDAGPKLALSITKPQTHAVHQPALQGKKRDQEPPCRTEEKLLINSPWGRENQATPPAETELHSLRADAQSYSNSRPPSSALRAFRFPDEAGLESLKTQAQSPGNLQLRSISQ